MPKNKLDVKHDIGGDGDIIYYNCTMQFLVALVFADLPSLAPFISWHDFYSLGSRPSPFVHICTIYKRMRCTHKRGRPGLKYHVRIVGGAIAKALLLFPEARSPSHLVEELLACRIICTTYGFLSIWLLR